MWSRLRAATASKDASNVPVTFKERIGLTPYQAMYVEKKDASDYRAFRCKAWVYLEQATPRERKAHAEGKRSSLCWICSKHEHGGILSSRDQENNDKNQVRFDEHEFPFRKRKMVEHHLSDNSTDILVQQASNVIWVPYNKPRQ